MPLLLKMQQQIMHPSTSSHFLPLSESSSTSAGIQSLSTPNVGQSNQSSSNAALPSTSAPSSPSSMLSDTDDTLVPPAFQIIHEKPDKSKDLAKLTEIFPQLTAEQLKYIYLLPSRNRFDSAVACLMKRPTLEALWSLAVMRLVVPLSESPYIRGRR